ncbi:MAG: methyltransferase [Flavobacteriaceae bacterium]|nr:methyltransferase [Flavobacteriaceae bacterium]
MINFDETYWDNRYKEGTTGWNIGHVSMPLKEYIDQLNNPSISVLIPGAGNAYEAEYLFEKGFKNVTVLDISETALLNFQQRVPNFPEKELVHTDFFQFQGAYDLILEQTFFCALDPSLRIEYARKMYSLLKPEGKLIGLLFDFPLTQEGPPFGGSKDEYLGYFKPYFNIEILTRCYNSIPQRAGKELFFKLLKK